MGEHTGVGDDRAGPVGALERPLQRPVEDGLVPARELLARREPERVGCRDRLVGPRLQGHGLVVAAPEDDRRVVAEQVHRLPRLPGRLLPDASGVAAVQGQVLPKQKAVAVGRVVQLGPAHVAVDAQEIQAGRRGQHDVAIEVVRRRLGQLHPRRALARPLEEEALAVDRQHPPRHPHLAQPHRSPGPVARRGGPVGRGDLDRRLVERLVAHGVGPPQGGALDGHRPLHPVLPGGQGLLLDVLDGAHRGAQPDCRAGRRVEHGQERHDRPLGGCLAAEDAQAADAHSTGALEGHRPPDAPRVPVRVDVVGVLEHTGDVPFGRPVVLGRAGDLDGKEVLGPLGQRGGHLEGVREEIALAVPQVGPVQPDVGLIEDAVEGQPPPLAVVGAGGAGDRRRLERRPVVGGEGGAGAPVAGDGHGRPVTVVEPGLGERPPERLVGVVRPPGSVERPAVAPIHPVRLTGRSHVRLVLPWSSSTPSSSPSCSSPPASTGGPAAAATAGPASPTGRRCDATAGRRRPANANGVGGSAGQSRASGARAPKGDGPPGADRRA